MNISDLRDKFESEVALMLSINKGQIKRFRDGLDYNKEHINDAWKDYQKEANKAQKMQMVQRDV